MTKETAIKRTQIEWGKIAGEEITVEVINSTLYAFASELGALRIANRFDSMVAEYSENLKKWFVTKEIAYDIIDS